MAGDLFAGAARSRGYADAGPEPSGCVPVDESQPREDIAGAQAAASTAVAGPGAQVARQVGPQQPAPQLLATPRVRRDGADRAPSRRPVAQWGWRRAARVLSGGLLRLPPGAAEAAHRADVRLVRQSTWPRPQGILVANPKGGSGKTPTTLLLTGTLAWIRGGYVAAWEASEAPGNLAARAEGEPARGLAELLTSAADVTSAGALGGFCAPQTSYADVIGSAGPREQLHGEDVETVRAVLGRYYRLTVADTGNNPQSPLFERLVALSDALVVPTAVHPDDLDGVLALARELARTGHGRDLLRRAVVVVTHTGATEPPGVLAQIGEHLTALGVAEVVDVPYDPVIAAAGEITLADLSPRSRRAWVRVAAAVVTSLIDAESGGPEPPSVRALGHSTTSEAAR